MSTRRDHSDDIALAGEYVLHLLDASDRVAFEARMDAEPALRDLVRDWDGQLALLAQDTRPITPPAAVKAKLVKTLFAEPVPAARGILGGFSGRIWIWLTAGVLAAGLFGGLAFFTPAFGPQTAPAFTASVAAEDGSLVVVANFTPQTNTLQITREAGGALPGRVLELWLIADGASAPVSLGVLPQDREARMIVPDALARQMAGAVLAISDEPMGGSPTGAPTGAVLAVGPITNA